MKNKVEPNTAPSYEAVGQAIREAAEAKRLTVWKIAKTINEQHNTVQRIYDGHYFLAHHCIWIKQLLDIDVLEILSGEGSHEKRKVKKQTAIEDLI